MMVIKKEQRTLSTKYILRAGEFCEYYLASSFKAAAAAAFRFCEALGLRSSESGLLLIILVGLCAAGTTVHVVPFGVEREPERFEKRVI